jgi:hypothetical protein
MVTILLIHQLGLWAHDCMVTDGSHVEQVVFSFSRELLCFHPVPDTALGARQMQTAASLPLWYLLPSCGRWLIK